MCASQRARGEGFWCATDITEHTWFVALSEKWDQLCLFSVRRHQSSTVESSVTPVTPSRREAGSGCSTSRHLHHFLSFCLVWLTQACPTAVCSPRWSLQKIHFCFPNLMCDQEHTFAWFPETSLHSGSLQWDRVSAAAACLNPDLLSVGSTCWEVLVLLLWVSYKNPAENLHKRFWHQLWSLFWRCSW